LVLLAAGCTPFGANRLALFNGRDFSGWTYVLSDTTVSFRDVWSVRDGVIHCTGVPDGYLRTEASFADYRLHLEWRWEGEPTNSGVLLHCQDPDRIWPNAVECQLQAGNAGDFVLIGPSRMTVGDSIHAIARGWRVIPKRHASSENPAGEWNTMEITVAGDRIVCEVNGILQNEANVVSLVSGPIALQSEGSPIRFRNIWIESLEESRE